LQSLYKFLTTYSASRLTLETMKLLRHFFTMVCIVAAFIANAGEQLTAEAKDAANQTSAAELQLLQGTWQGVEVGDQRTSKKPDLQKASEGKPDEIDMDFLGTGVLGSPPESHGIITITISGNSFHFHRDTNFWFETTITLPADTDPKQLHATIKGCPPSQASSIGQVVGAIFKIEDGTLILATRGGGAEETPKSFEATEEKGLTRYELRKVQPQKKNTQPPKTK
jgi:uncharacterized protein (TIGR03067 family)